MSFGDMRSLTDSAETSWRHLVLEGWEWYSLRLPRERLPQNVGIGLLLVVFPEPTHNGSLVNVFWQQC